MSKVRRIDFYPDEYIAGVAGILTPEQQGVYWMVCALISSKGGPIDDDPKRIGRLMLCGRAKMDRILSELADRGFLGRNHAKLSQKRAETEVKAARERIESYAERGQKGGKKSQKDQQNQRNAQAEQKIAQKQPATTNHQLPTTNHHIEDTPDGVSIVDETDPMPDWMEGVLEDPAPEDPPEDLPARSAPVEVQKPPYPGWQPGDVQAAFDSFCQTARQWGLAVPEKLSPKRRSSIMARLKDAGGPEGWGRMLAQLGQSPHCLGDNPGGWRADLDFALKPDMFQRIIEGSFTRSPAPVDAPPSTGRKPAGTAYARAADKMLEELE